VVVRKLRKVDWLERGYKGMHEPTIRKTKADAAE
jgi:hypothetical protein